MECGVGVMLKWLNIVVIVIIGVINFFAFIAEAQEFDSSNFNDAKFETFIEDTMEASNIPGLAVIIFEGDVTLYENAIGIANAQKTPVTLDTPFQLGSVSKTFAALLMVQLAAEGTVNLDAPVITYLPNFRLRNSEGGETITVRDILSHRSGFAMIDGNRIQEGQYRGEDALTIAVKGLENATLKSVPGTAFEYSNANYMIAAAVIEAVTGQTYETVMDERIFQPLGMKNSYVQMPLRETVEEAVGFRQWFGVSKAHKNIAGRAYVAAGGVTASARDLAVYLKAIINQDPRILPAAYADQIFSRQGEDTNFDWGYGLGWMIQTEGAKTLKYHSGLNGGFAAHIAFTSEDARGGVVITNQSGFLQADVPAVIIRKGLGLEPGLSRPSTGAYLMIGGLVATALSLIFFFGLSTLRFNAYARRVGRVNVFRRVLPSLALFALAYMLVAIVPKMNAITLSGLKVFYPDLWLCFSVSAIFAIIWGVTRLIFPLDSWKKRET